ncbi:MAG: hypothetical protein AB7K78_04625, partial [Xanthobacteraceae bacterium]
AQVGDSRLGWPEPGIQNFKTRAWIPDSRFAASGMTPENLRKRSMRRTHAINQDRGPQRLAPCGIDLLYG